MSTPFRLLLPRSLYVEMIAQARAEFPNEACGLLAGTVSGGTARVARLYPLVNAAASPVEYLSEPKSMFAAVRDLERAGLCIIAIYHSHPTSAPVPSRTDRERNYSPEVMNLIISLQGSESVMRGWWLTAENATEAAWEVIPPG